MKKASNIWVRRGLLLHRLHGQELALALLLKQKPMSAPQICSSLLEKEIRFDRKKIGKLLADLEWWGVVSNDSGVYSCQCAVLDNCQESYNESQLIDLIGLTQNTVNGQSFYSFILVYISLFLSNFLSMHLCLHNHFLPPNIFWQ